MAPLYNTDYRRQRNQWTGIVDSLRGPRFLPRSRLWSEPAAAPKPPIVQLEILAEDTVRGTASPLPGAVMDLGDSVVRIFHFNTRSKVWTFYDPREEFEGLNSLTELAAGQPYSILVSENVENVVLNGRTREPDLRGRRLLEPVWFGKPQGRTKSSDQQ